jgi:hypothetical protein
MPIPEPARIARPSQGRARPQVDRLGREAVDEAGGREDTTPAPFALHTRRNHLQPGYWCAEQRVPTRVGSVSW